LEFSNSITATKSIPTNILNMESIIQNEEDINKTLTDDDLSFNSEKEVKLDLIPKLENLEDSNILNEEIKNHQGFKYEFNKDNDQLESLLSNGNNFSLRDEKMSGKCENFNQGRWLPEEHKKFIEAMYIYGNEWKKVQEYIGTRSSTQARSHAQKFFIRLRKKFSNDNDSYDGDTVQRKSDKIMSWIKEYISIESIMKNYHVK
jgi:SHAQKYF class myb-like DNA-binding protein